MKKLLLGLGVSNSSIKSYFDKNKIEYDIYDSNKNINLNEYEMVIKSNGFKNDYPLLIEARLNHIMVYNDLSLFVQYKKDSYNSILVTGSNGKTTIVSLLEEVINNGKAIGNNGLPFFDYIDENYNYILEVSSFMLETAKNVSFKFNVITNLFITHLEHHGSFMNYIKSKCSFLKHIKKDSFLIYNYDDVLLRRIVNNYECKKVSFSRNNKLCDLFICDNYIYYHNNKLLSIENLNLIGEHNLYNIMSVLGVLMNYDDKKDNYLDIIKNFKGVKHRIELISDGKVKIYNDSKSTNYNALRVSLDCFKNKRVLLIVGGKKREENLDIIKDSLKQIYLVYAFGENKDNMKSFFKKEGIKCKTFTDLNHLVNDLPINDENIDVILFSPASTSFDLYNNFEERGIHFKRLINKLLEKF